MELWICNVFHLDEVDSYVFSTYEQAVVCAKVKAYELFADFLNDGVEIHEFTSHGSKDEEYFIIEIDGFAFEITKRKLDSFED